MMRSPFQAVQTADRMAAPLPAPASASLELPPKAGLKDRLERNPQPLMSLIGSMGITKMPGVQVPAKTSAVKMIPPNFGVSGGQAVYVDIKNIEVELTFDVASRKALVQAKVAFEQDEKGFPIINLVPEVQSASIDGKALAMGSKRNTLDPDSQHTLSYLACEVAPGFHTAEFGYELSGHKSVRFDPQGVEFFQSATDLKGPSGSFGYSEHYFPSNAHEGDQYTQVSRIKITNGSREHQIFSNGVVTKDEEGSFRVNFPGHFNSASFFLDVVDPSRYTIVEETYEGKAGPIPIEVYGTHSLSVEIAAQRIRDVLAELEHDYGPWAHPGLTVRVQDNFGGGMEYAGATITDHRALEHEVMHSWFARGVMPWNGDAGWIDEAIASWRDEGYPRAGGIDGSRSFPRLSGVSPYRRDTPREAYNHGQRVISQLDFVLRDSGGLKPVLKELFGRYQHQTITTKMFEDFVAERAGKRAQQVHDIFAAQVYGNAPGFIIVVGEQDTGVEQNKSALNVDLSR